jgi:hypothetical protein
MVAPNAARTPSAARIVKAVPASSLPPVEAVPAGGDDIVPAFDVERLRRALDAASAEADALIFQFKEGAGANASAFKAAKLELARAKLKALKLAAAVNALRGDAGGALRVSEEAAKVARALKRMRGEKTETPAVAADFEPTIVALVQTARKVIAIARQATRPGSPEDEAMADLQRRTGVPDAGIDVVAGSDMALAANDLDVVAQIPERRRPSR